MDSSVGSFSGGKNWRGRPSSESETGGFIQVGAFPKVMREQDWIRPLREREIERGHGWVWPNEHNGDRNQVRHKGLSFSQRTITLVGNLFHRIGLAFTITQDHEIFRARYDEAISHSTWPTSSPSSPDRNKPTRGDVIREQSRPYKKVGRIFLGGHRFKRGRRERENNK